MGSASVSTVRTKQLDEVLVEGLTNGIPLRQLCRENKIGKSAVYSWIEKDKELAGRIAQARARGEEELLDQCLEIADTPEIGEEITIKDDGATEVKHFDMLGHRKLQIETRLKLLAKWNPKKYGEKMAVGGADDLPAIKTDTDPADVARRVAFILTAAMRKKQAKE